MIENFIDDEKNFKKERITLPPMENLSLIRSFREKFYSLVSQIPEGRVSTYGELARSLGSNRAARAVGKMLNENPRPEVVPCHRVVKSDGTLGGYDRGKEEKKKLLEKEGVSVEDEEIVNFEEVLFTDFQSDKPLETLREEQMELKEKVSFGDDEGDFATIAGVDVSYSEQRAYPAISLWDRKKKEEKEAYVTKVEVDFPYIPTFLAFRELPPLLDVLSEAETKPDVVMVDGNGVMHPHEMGLASHLGLETKIPTVGVAKSKLCGKIMEDVDKQNRVSEVRKDGSLIGHAVLEGERAKNPIYVSPGHKVSHENAVDLVREFCQYKVPDPIRRAHIKATKRRKKDE
ncbi:MAG: endonuclease V [Candidatus Thermoplasmatota archaeon]|nr:endonuclease V [Candidatus Thermoplasmatota archaeon]